ncbi:MAG: VWA domain-containing protein [Nannocystis sp.]|nr:VWA domain-containing protein [Nannocystis sp.]
MTLLAPLALIALIGLALPLLAHRRGRPTPRVIHFAALRFLREGDEVLDPRQRLRDRLLLALRLLLLALIALAAARPVSDHDADLYVLGAPHDAVILLDASRSMGLRIDGETRLEAAERACLRLLDALPPGSRVALASNDPAVPRLDLSADHGPVRAVLAQLAAEGPRPGAWPLIDALPVAAALAPAQADRPRVLYAVGDRTEGGLAGLPSAGPAELPLVLLPVDGAPLAELPSSPPHLGVTAVTYEPAPELDPRALRIRARIRHYGAHTPPQERRVAVLLRARGREIARAELAVLSGEEAEIELLHVLAEAGPLPLSLELELADDPLPSDDRRALWLDQGADLKVLLINGDPSEQRARDELYFLSAALAAPEQRPRAVQRALAPDQLEGELRRGPALLEGVDVLVLANVPAPAADVAAAIAGRVRAGMGLWITVGERVDAAAYERVFRDLLPLALREPVLAGSLPGRAEASGEGVAPAELSHPIFRDLAAGGEQTRDLGLAGARARRLYLLEPDLTRLSAVALSFQSGAPLLITREHGRGRVALLTTTIDRDWSDLPLRPGFVPLVTQTVTYLAAHRVSAGDRQLLVGEPWTADLPGPLSVLTPSGHSRPLLPHADGWRYADTYQPGHYQVLGQPGEAPRTFTVNIDPRESDTTPRPLLAPDRHPDAALARAQRPRWRPLLLLALIVLGAESLLRLHARRRR